MDYIPNNCGNYLISLRSTKHLRLSTLLKDTNTLATVGARTRSLVIRSPHCSTGPHALLKTGSGQRTFINKGSIIFGITLIPFKIHFKSVFILYVFPFCWSVLHLYHTSCFQLISLLDDMAVNLIIQINHIWISLKKFFLHIHHTKNDDKVLACRSCVLSTYFCLNFGKKLAWPEKNEIASLLKPLFIIESDVNFYTKIQLFTTQFHFIRVSKVSSVTESNVQFCNWIRQNVLCTQFRHAVVVITYGINVANLCLDQRDRTGFSCNIVCEFPRHICQWTRV